MSKFKPLQFKALSGSVLASPQLEPSDLADAKAQGVTLVVNNRPDGEAPDQTPGAEIEAAAKAEGLDYVAIPISGSFDGAKVERLRDALASNDGKALVYCRTGTRSAHLWGLAEARNGTSIDAIKASGQQAGYDLSRLDDLLAQL